jgi:hypothetical protein
MRSGTSDDYTRYQTACLTGGRSARVQEPIAIAGTDRAVAETTLRITSQFSGDNYQVRASMQKPHNLEPFDKRSSWTTNDTYVTSSIKESETMIAWKRVYIEQDNMYTLGATITADAVAGATNLTVDSTADFSVGDSVVVFWTNGSFNTTISAKPPAPVNSIYITSGGSGYTSAPSVDITGGGGTNATATATIRHGRVVSITLTSGGTGYTSPPNVIISGSATATATLGLLEVPAIPSAVRRFAGIRPAVEPDDLPSRPALPDNAFGRLPDGSDGGAFIEFLDAPTGSGKVPKYTSFRNSAEARAYSIYWFANYAYRSENVRYLLAARAEAAHTTFGWAFHAARMTIAFDGPIKQNDVQRENTVAHEIGHTFGLIGPKIRLVAYGHMWMRI